MKKSSGFTLIELMIAMVIVGVLLTVGVPAMKTFLQNNQLIAASNELLSALHIARSEAIKLNSRVTICDSDDGKTCAQKGDWSKGWVVFVDADGNLAGTGEPCAALNTDCLLRVHDDFSDNLLSVSGVDANAAAIESFTFTARGTPKDTSGVSTSGVFSVCSFDKNDNVLSSRAVVLSLSGRARVSDNTAVISCPAAP